MKASGDRVFFIAEVGVNHNGSIGLALELVDAATEAGADAVKFQTFRAGTLLTGLARKADYQILNTGSDQSQFEMIEQLELDPRAHFRLKERCDRRGIEFLSTPFDLPGANFLVREIGIKKIKISSGDLNYSALLLHVARTGLPVILSTGMSSLDEIQVALSVLAFGYLFPDSALPPSRPAFRRAYESVRGRELLAQNVSLLQCTTNYPAPAGQINLRAMATLKKVFGLPVGFSDHSDGIAVSCAAAALGATILEKHLTMDRTLSGPDHAASLEPRELGQLVRGVRQIELALGTPVKTCQETELGNRSVARRSLVATREIQPGEKFTEMNLSSKRPGSGVEPIFFWDFLGKSAKRAYVADEPIDFEYAGE